MKKKFHFISVKVLALLLALSLILPLSGAIPVKAEDTSIPETAGEDTSSEDFAPALPEEMIPEETVAEEALTEEPAPGEVGSEEPDPDGPTPQEPDPEDPEDPEGPEETPVAYVSGYLDGVGWVDLSALPEEPGEETPRLQAMQILTEDSELWTGSTLSYRTHVSGLGWEHEWSANGAVSGEPEGTRQIEALQISLDGPLAEAYDLYYCVKVRTLGWLNWAVGGTTAGTTGAGYPVEALKILFLPKGSDVPEPFGERMQAYYPKITAIYSSHVQKIGWQTPVTSGNISGTSGKKLRVEALTGTLKKLYQFEDSGLIYRTSPSGLGWEEEWRADGEISGTTGQARPLEALAMELYGSMAEEYDIYYCVHVSKLGWLNWACNGAPAGTGGYGYQIEAYCVRIVIKGTEAPEPKSGRPNAFEADFGICYSSHIQKIGWQKEARDGALSGTSGQDLRIEALRMTLKEAGLYPDSGIEYRSHVQKTGWESEWKKDGEISGSTGMRRRIEAIQFRLYGSIAEEYDLYYCVYSADVGWLAWAKNGETAGTSGYSLRIEAFRVVLVAKGDPVPEAPGEAIAPSLTSVYVNDPLISNQWYLDRLHAFWAWSLVRQFPHEKIRVALVDSGAETDHEDLTNVLNKEFCVDITKEGAPNFTNDSSIGDWESESGHGTRTASILGGEANNGVGMAGVASCGDNSVLDLIMIKAQLDEEPGLNYAQYIAAGIEKAIDIGARIISVSMSVKESDPAIEAAVKRAYDNGIIVVCCASNFYGNVTRYPAGYPYVIEVGGLYADNTWCEWAVYNSQMDIAAYAYRIFGANLNNSYVKDSGTSFATPMVAAVIAMMLSVNPDLTWLDIYKIITTTANDVSDPGFDMYTGYGGIDAYRCVNMALLYRYGME